jgi:DNA-binding CsgD family transcriptional regulator
MAKKASTHHSHRLDAPDVRAMLRLCNDLHTSPQRDDYKQKLLEGVSDLADADRAWVSVAAFGSAANSEPQIVSAVHLSRTGLSGKSSPDLIEHVAPWGSYREYGKRLNTTAWPATDWCTSAQIATRRRGVRPQHFVHSFIPLAGGRVAACLTVTRSPDRRQFTGRDCSVVCVMHSEAGWVYRSDVMLLSPETRSLSPRERETLQHLLDGKSEKQIAVAMRLSHNTIHHYVKALHRHFKVSSRSELLAKWVK